MNGNCIRRTALEIAHSVRSRMESKYGSFLGGCCIEASNMIAERLCTKTGLSALPVEGWCKFDDETYGSDRPWSEHTWVEVPEHGLYIDVTADQFNFGMYKENEYQRVIVQTGLPYGMQYEEPTWETY